MIKRLLACITLLLSSISFAQAADDIQIQADEGIYDWNGAYVGLQAGFGASDTGFLPGVPVFDQTGSQDGFVAGLYVGYNHLLSDQLVIGLEADINYSDVSGTIANPVFTFPVDIDYFASIRARLGLVHNDVLYYATGGYAYMSGNHVIVPVGNATFDDSLNGWTAGAGVEFLLTNDYVGRLEYRYHDFDENYAANAQGLGVIAHTYEVDLQTFMFGVSRKF